MPKKTNYYIYQTLGKKYYKDFKKLGFIDPKTVTSEIDMYNKVIDAGKKSTGKFMRDLASIMVEFKWRTDESPIIFVENTHLANMIYNAKFDIDTKSIASPRPNFICFSFPVGTEIEGYKIKSCLFGKIKYKDHFDFVSKTLENILGEHMMDGLAEEISKDPGEEIFFLMSDNGYGISTIFVPADKACEFLNKDLDDFLGNNKDLSMDEQDGQVTDDRISEQKAYLRLCLGICVYIKAFPENLIKGIPENSETIGINSARYNRTIMLDHEFRSSPVAHWRKWHFRTLRHEKFKRNQDGSEKIIFVRDAIVGKDQDMSIMTKNKGQVLT
jgi:hypothetical protein